MENNFNVYAVGNILKKIMYMKTENVIPVYNEDIF